MEYCCNVWAGVPNCSMVKLGQLQKRKCRAVVATVAASFEPLDHPQNVI